MSFGTYLIVWLVVGFIVGIKEVYVMQVLDGKKLEDFKNQCYEKNGKNDTIEGILNFTTNKTNYIIMCTLLGFIALIANIIGIYRNIKIKGEW